MAPANGVLSTTSELMSIEAFHGIVWAFFALCTILFIGRLWIRWISFRRFFREDYLMFFVLCLQLATAIVCQLRLVYIYEMEDVGNGVMLPPATFLEDVPKGLRGLLATQVLTVVALWGVKFNFLLFFYRIFCSASRLYRNLWWVVVMTTVACFGVFTGLLSYKCTASDVSVIMTTCTEPSEIRLEWIQVQTTSAIDAFNDALIMVFPIAILWKVRISLKKKLWLSFMFALSLLTIAMAIIRGTISYGRVARDYSQSQNVSWVWFWLQMELIVSFLVACLTSFQALFTQPKKNRSTAKDLKIFIEGNRPRTFGSSGKVSKPKGWSLYDTIVDTCYELEGVTQAGSHELDAIKHDAEFDDLEADRTRVGDASRDDSYDRLPLDSYCLAERYVDIQGQPVVVNGTEGPTNAQPCQAHVEPGQAR